VGFSAGLAADVFEWLNDKCKEWFESIYDPK